MRFLTGLALLSSTLACAVAHSISGHIVPGDVLQDVTFKELTSVTRVTLDGGRYSARIARGGYFELQGVNEGTWILDVVCPGYVFDQLLIELPAPPAEPQVYPHTPFAPLSPLPNITLPYPIQLAARQKRMFVPKDEGFAGQIKGMVGNPMMLMMIASAAMVLVLPKMLSNMDPEALKDASTRREKIMRGDLAGGLGGMLEGPPPRIEEIPEKKKPAMSDGGARAKGKKRR